jgi:hypothetical protein
MRFLFLLLPFVAFGIAWSAGAPTPSPADQPLGVAFVFKGKSYFLNEKMRLGGPVFGPHDMHCNNACLDTLCNRYQAAKHYVELIRQDDGLHPTTGLALGFEFDESNGEYPYTPSYAVLQFKDFRWGGLEFSRQDTCNYTGLSDKVSDDLQIEIDSFINNTIYGRFSGLLLNGAGGMAVLDSGFFRIFLYRE